MIELLVEADQAVSLGLLDKAERLFNQVVEHDARNSIAIAGLARVALERGDERRSHALATAALRLDPENYAARRIASRTADVLVARGESIPSPAVVGSSQDRAGEPSNGSEDGGSPADLTTIAPKLDQAQSASARPRGRGGLLRRLFGGR